MSVTACWILAGSCNQRHNAFQMGNPISLLASGFSDQVNDYLHPIGLTSSQEKALRALDVSWFETKENLHRDMSKTYCLWPFFFIDKIDIETQIHYWKITKERKAFHSTRRDFHVLPKSLTSHTMSAFRFVTMDEDDHNTKILDVVYNDTWYWWGDKMNTGQDHPLDQIFSTYHQ